MVDSYAFYKDKLESEYLRIFDKVELYCIASNTPSEVLEERLMELIDILLVAQKEEREVKSIVGTDVERFCRDFIGEAEAGKIILNTATIIKRLSIVALVFVFLDVIIAVREGQSFFEMKNEMAPLLLGGLMGAFFSILWGFIYRKYLFSYKFATMKTFTISSFILIFGMAILDVALCKWLSIEIKSWMVLLNAAIYLVGYYIWRAKRYPKIKQPKNEVKFSDMVVEESKKQRVGAFEKKNAKLEKKGKKLITDKEFTEKRRKYNKQSLFMNNWGWVVFVVIVALFALPAFNKGVNFDSVLYVVILCVVEFVVYNFFRKSMSEVAIWEKELLDECDARGIGMIECLKEKEGQYEE